MPYRRRRRATVLVFVMAILVLLALLGLGMMIATRTERQKLTPQRETFALETIADRAVLIVRQRLREDIWGVGDANVAVPLNRAIWKTAGDPCDPNSNEPFDAPGPEDRWLASTYPYMDASTDPNGLRWFRVSYLGPIRGEPNEASNPLAPADDPNDEPNSWLRDVSLTIENDDSGIPDPNDASFVPGNGPWDVDGNEKIDLYDSDGDGVPDAPISFTFPIDTPTPVDRPKHVHVAVRIVDNASKVNVNTANSRFRLDVNPTDTGDKLKLWLGNFDETTPDLQLRGRRVGEVMLDAVARGDLLRFYPPRYPTRDLIRALWNHPAEHDPAYEEGTPYLDYYAYGVRRQLVGGATPADPAFRFPTYGLRDEASLTHRFCLVPPDPRGRTDTPGWTRRIDDDLFRTLCWARWPEGQESLKAFEVPWYWAITPTEDLSRWRRFGYDERLDGQPSADPDPNMFGWQTLLNPEHRWVVKRGMLTAYNGESDRRWPGRRTPTDVSDKTYNVVLRADGSLADHYRRLCCTLDEANNQLAGGPNEPAYLYPVRVESDGDFEARIQGMYDYEKVSLNYPIDRNKASDEPNQAALKADYVTMLAWAFYMSGAIAVADPNEPVEAWQAAANVCDYRDADLEPTIVKYGSAVIAVGLEPQPFISEVNVRIGNPDPENLVRHRLDVEMYLPFAGVEYDAGTFQVQVTDPDWGPTDVPEMDGDEDTRRRALNPFDVDPTDAGFIGFSQSTVVVLSRTISGGTAPDVTYVCDRFLLGGGAYVDDTADWSDTPGATNNFQREDDPNLWLIGVAKSKLSNDAGTATINAENVSTGFGAALPPSHWVFRNTGIVASPEDPNHAWANHWWTFDTPGELSRVLVYGNTLAGAPVPERLALAYSTIADLDQRLAAGRLDFFGTKPAAEGEPDPRLIFGYVTALSANHDGIDNDGDALLSGGGIDEGPIGTARSEADTIDYRRVGRINVNTAPTAVLYAVPFMVEPFESLYLESQDPSHDIAAGIVALRERRSVKSVWGKWDEKMATPTSSTDPAVRFRTLGDLGEVTRVPLSGSSDFCANRYGLTAELPDHATAPWSPDFDASDAAADDPNGLNAHDGSAAVEHDVRDRDIFLARWGNILTTRSDVYTVYIALIDDEGRYLHRCQFTLDRTNCFRDPYELPMVLGRTDTNYYDDTR